VLYRTRIDVTDHKFPNSYTGLETQTRELPVTLPAPGDSTTAISLWYVFAYVQRYDRIRVYRFSLELDGAAWTNNVWRGRIIWVIQQYPSNSFYGPNYSDVVLDRDTTHTLESLIFSSPRDRGDYSYRLIIQASCVSRSGPGPFEVIGRVGAETWQVASHEP